MGVVFSSKIHGDKSTAVACAIITQQMQSRVSSLFELQKAAGT